MEHWVQGCWTITGTKRQITGICLQLLWLLFALISFSRQFGLHSSFLKGFKATIREIFIVLFLCFQVGAHYFEEGNVQLDAKHECKDTTVFQVIIKFFMSLFLFVFSVAVILLKLELAWFMNVFLPYHRWWGFSLSLFWTIVKILSFRKLPCYFNLKAHWVYVDVDVKNMVMWQW